MSTEYQRLGDYIREVNLRNRELKVTNLLGMSISKKFIPSIANTIGTDMSTYKIIKRNQFAYVPVTSRNGEKITIALLDCDDEAIISQAYTVFEIVNHEQLLPEYLMMWFRRPEFDRYARFHSHGSAREVFDWDELCEVRLPVPTLARQREIVAEYETLGSRIRLNEQMIAKLEETAQALYRKMFVEGIDKENLPAWWRRGTIGEIIIPQKGRNIVREDCVAGMVPVIAGGKTPSCYHNQSNTKNPVVTISASGANAGFVSLHFDKVWAADCSYIDIEMCPYLFFVYAMLIINQEKLYSMQEGTGQPHIYPSHIMSLQTNVPSVDAMKEYHKQIAPVFKEIELRQQENEKLTELQSLLLARMGK